MAKATTTGEPRVMVYIPKIEDAVGARVDQTEHVTINGRTTIVQRGEHVEVPVDVFAALKVKYPEL